MPPNMRRCGARSRAWTLQPLFASAIPMLSPGKPGSGYFRMTFHDIHPL
jgi:hypothetical protein